MQLRLSTQALDNSLNLAKLEADFLNSIDWNITNGNNNALITGLKDPVNPYDAVNKEYVDNIASSSQWKHSIKALAIDNVTLSGIQSVDDVSCFAGDLVGCFNQTTTSEDGVYVAQSGAWTRAEGWEVGVGTANFVFSVEEGGINADTQWTVSNNSGSDVIGTDDLVLKQAGGYNFTDGLTKTGSTVRLGGLLHRDVIIGSDDGVNYSSKFVKIGTRGASGYPDVLSTISTGVYGTSMLYKSNANKWSALSSLAEKIQLEFRDNNGATGHGTRITINSASGDNQSLKIGGDIANYSFAGAQYEEDYSLNYTDRSLVDKAYVDNLVDGLQWKHSVRVLATGNITLSDAQTIDGVSCIAGDLVGCFNQTTTTEDGVYVVQSGAWARAEGWKVGVDSANFSFLVEEGTANADSQWTVTNNSGSDVIGTDDLVLVQTGGPGGITAGNGLTLTGNTLDVVAADLSLVINADDMAVNIGNTNGDSLEVSATGLELNSSITGNRTFSAGSFTVDAGNNPIVLKNANTVSFRDAEVYDAGNDNPMPLAITTTVDHGHGLMSGSIVNDFNAKFTDRAIINAIVENHDAILGNSKIYENGIVEDSGHVKLGGLLTEDTSIGYDGSSYSDKSFLVGSSSGGGESTKLNVFPDYVRMTWNDNNAHSTGKIQVDSSEIGLFWYSQPNSSTGYGTGIKIASEANNQTLTIEGDASHNTFAGAQYKDDYSANYTDRSLVDKAYVDTKYLFENGISASAGDVYLGGMLSRDTRIGYQAGPGYSDNTMVITSGGGSVNDQAELDLRPGRSKLTWTDTSTEETCSLQASSESITMAWHSTNNAQYGTRIMIASEANNQTLKIGGDIANNSFAGAQYVDDYSSFYTDRSLVDKAYVDNIAVGFTYSEEVIIVADNHSVTLTGGDTASIIKRVYQNGNKLIPTEFTVGDDGAHRTITEAGDANFTNGDAIEVEYVA